MPDRLGGVVTAAWKSLFWILYTFLFGRSGRCTPEANIRRIDPNSGVNITWSIRSVTDLATYDVINITVNHSDVIFSCLPALRRCDDVTGADSQPRFVIIHGDRHRYNRSLDTTTSEDSTTASTTAITTTNITTDDDSNNKSIIVAVGFELSYVNVTHAGVYTLTMVRGATITEYDDIVLYVYQNPTEPTIIGSLGLKEVGEQLTLECADAKIRSVPIAYRNLSQLVYSWYRNGELVAGGKQLTIARLSKTDNGARFSCVVGESGSSSAETPSRVITVHVAYVDDVSIVVEGDGGRLSCRADCYPECSYQWLDASGRQLANTSQLTGVSHVSGTNLSCQARNGRDVGSTSTFVYYTQRRPGLAVIVIGSLVALFSLVVSAELVYVFTRWRRRRRADVHGQAPVADVVGSDFDRYRYERQKSADRSATSTGLPQLAAGGAAYRTATPVSNNASMIDSQQSAEGGTPSAETTNSNVKRSTRRRKNIVTIDFDSFADETFL